MTYLIDLSNANSSNTLDLTIMGASSLHDTNGNPSNTIYEQLTGSTTTCR
jgi:hypothetical protein